MLSNAYKFLAVFGLSIVLTSPSTAFMLSSTLDHLKQDLDRRIRDVQTSNLTDEYKKSALSQLRNMKARYNTAYGLKSVKSQEKAANDMCKQLQREIQMYDTRLYQYKAASMRETSRSKKKS